MNKLTFQENNCYIINYKDNEKNALLFDPEYEAYADTDRHGV